MIDYHCHLLPGLDDGPSDWDESLAMAKALADFGFREVCCTPHCIKGHYEISPVEVREAVRKLQARLDFEEIALKLHPGMEYYLDECFEQYAANLLPLGGSKLVLCEAPPQAHPGLVAEMAGLIVVQGFIPLIAHPERSDVIWEMLEEQGRGMAVSGDDGNLAARGVPRAKPKSFWGRFFAQRASSEGLRDSAEAFAPPAARHALSGHSELPDACFYQANLGSFTGYYGPKPQRRAYDLLQRGIYHCLASDLHDARSATAGFEAAREKLEFNPALQKLGAFVAPQGQGGSDQLAFW